MCSLTRCVQEVTGSHRAGRGTLSWSRCSSRPFLEAVRASICVTERPSSAIVEAVRASIHVRAAAAAVAGRCGSVGNPRHRCERAFALRYGRRRPLWRRCVRAYTYVPPRPPSQGGADRFGIRATGASEHLRRGTAVVGHCGGGATEHTRTWCGSVGNPRHRCEPPSPPGTTPGPSADLIIVRRLLAGVGYPH